MTVPIHTNNIRHAFRQALSRSDRTFSLRKSRRKSPCLSREFRQRRNERVANNLSLNRYLLYSSNLQILSLLFLFKELFYDLAFRR